MNIEDLKKLSVEDALQTAAKFTGVDASVLEGMWRTESGKGKAMLSPAGARGHFGLMPNTQAAFEKKLGVKIDPNNFHESLFIAANHLKDDLQREGGNVVSALRAYNNGPKWREQKDPRGENAAYAAKVLGGRVPEVVEASDAGSAQQLTVNGIPNLDTPMPFVQPEGKPAKEDAKVTTLLASSAFLAGSRIDPQKADIGQAYVKTAEQDLARQQELDNTGFIDTARALYMHTGIGGAILKRASRGEYTPVPGYVYPEEKLAGLSEDDQSFLLQARSPDEAKQFEWELGVEREDMRRASLNGGWYALAAGVFAGLPEGVATGVGTAKLLAVAGMGSAAAVAAGNTGRAIGLNVLENVGGNLAATALEDAISGRMSAFDYAVAGTVGLAFSGPSAYGLAKEAGTRQQSILAARIAEDAIAKQREVAERAASNLGPGATADEIAHEISRLEVEETKASLGSGRVAEGRELVPDVEKLLEEEEALDVSAKTPGSPPATQQVGDKRPVELDKVIGPDGAPVVKQTLSAIEYLTGINSRPGDAVLKLLAGRLTTAIGDQDVKLYVVKDGEAGLLTPGHERAHYTPGKHAVILPESVVSSPKGNWVVTHEVAHAASTLKLEYGERNPDSAIGKVTQEIDNLRLFTQREAAKAGHTSKLTEYLLKDNHEFVAGLFSGRSEFTDLLKSIKLNEEKSVWNGFVDIMRRLLGIQENEMDAFTKALNLSEDLFSQRLESKLVSRTGQPVIRQAPSTSPMLPAQQAAADKYGINLLPQATPLQRAEQKAIAAIYARADDPTAAWNNIDPKWVDTLTAKFPAIGSTGLQMLRSNNPVVRMVATELLESTTGAGGRRTTASLNKYMAERKYMGNTINAFQDAYTVWRNAQGSGIYDDLVKGETWARFNRTVAEEIEARRTGVPSTASPEVVKAATILEAAYERMRVDQINNKTVGWGGLPETSKGYMPHRLSSEKVRNMTQAEHQAFHQSLMDQFITVEGWDISFAANLAAKYIDRAKVRAMGGHEIPANVHHTGAADVVRDALEAMGMSRSEIYDQMAKYMRGGAGHTKGRLNIDLLKEYDDNGRKFTLLDLYETDQLMLVRGQAQRVSGETALAKHGIMGKPGMQLLRRAMADFGADNGKAQPNEIEAFDQVASEFLGQPFGDYGGKWMNRAMQLNSLARLGGMGFTQFAEYINAATHLGVGRAMTAISGLPRLRAEAAKLARGEKVDNPIIGSIEVYGGAEFGTDAYKMVFPFDNPSLQYQVNGHDTVTLADRLLRGGSHAQGKLSFWRAIHGAQQRGVAEQIVHKAVKYIRDGGSDKALADMGIDAGLAAQLKQELPYIAKFDGAGRLAQFDITKSVNPEAAAAFVQAVHRGTGQIIQGTFIGETGKWAHSGWLRLLTQFRTFSITSVEKQWARNRNNYGVASALGMLMGSMAVAAPIYMARQYVNSVGREDQEEWLNKQLAPEKIARATLNYVAASGLAGDFLDAFASVTGVTQATGGRAGSTTEFVGTVIAPAAGLADDLWRGLQNSKDGTDVHEVIKNAPFAKLPWLVPVINLMDD